eukprot:TRINITY_DN4053_c0_g2_i2.p1 TRINITY_DN4053_c0_g2~~TRINITY_DN4053_c0_g2_i2.p1  ORF type:complete len:932 (+),score=124.69 TRINITY_DN4053_c0_g2_i2:87-2882(+)
MGIGKAKWAGALLGIWCFSLLECPNPVFGVTNSGDLAVLNAFKEGLKNPELLKWPKGGTDPCGDEWPHVFCSPQGRVNQIQVQGLGLEGPLPSNFNQLTELWNLGLQRNNFSGPLPTFRGLSKLQKAYLGTNNFDTIPSDFFVGLTALQILSLEFNNLNSSTGWTLPTDLQDSVSLTNLSLAQSNLAGTIPAFLGSMQNLQVLELAYNNLSGPIPSSFKDSPLVLFQMNNQGGAQLSGPIDVVSTMLSLKILWMHGNKFNGTIPSALGDCTNLQELKLNNNELVGPIPTTLSKCPLQVLTVDNNLLSGPIPDFNTSEFTYSENSFCQDKPGVPCAAEVTALLDFLGNVKYPVSLASSWTGNDPCNLWIGITCGSGKVSVIALPSRSLNGTISPSLSNLTSLRQINLRNNVLYGTVPSELTTLKSLTLLDLRNNNIRPPLPKFADGITVLYSGNPLLESNSSSSPVPSPSNPAEAPSGSPKASPRTSSNTSSPASGSPRSGSSSGSPHSGSSSNNTSPPPQSVTNGTQSSLSKRSVTAIVAPVLAATVILLLVIPSLFFYFCKKRSSKTVKTARPGTLRTDSSNDSSDPLVQIIAKQNGNVGNSIGSSRSGASSRPSDCQVVEAANLLISVQVLRDATGNFSPENELGRGGFGAVYKGTLADGTTIGVKRMEAAVISTKGLNEFQSEIAVLSKVRHRNLVSLLGYCIEGNERLLVYEYMPQGALSRHIFDWAKNGLEPISWERRLVIALDVARGMEYLHSLAHRSFIHRDLKPSNILLGDDFHAKVSDFGLVKLAPEGKHSIETRLAGTFGYLSPEYAGKWTILFPPNCIPSVFIFADPLHTLSYAISETEASFLQIVFLLQKTWPFSKINIMFPSSPFLSLRSYACCTCAKHLSLTSIMFFIHGVPSTILGSVLSYIIREARGHQFFFFFT